MSELITSAELASQLREAGRKLAAGEMNEVKLPLGYIFSSVVAEDIDKITPAYIRTTMNRVAEVKAKGRVSIAKVTGEDGEVYHIHLVPVEISRRPRVLTREEQRSMMERAAADALRRVAALTPAIDGFSDDELPIAARAFRLYRRLIEAEADLIQPETENENSDA